MLLEHTKIYLRPWKETDAPILYEYAKNPKIGLQAGWPPHNSIEESQWIIRELLTTWGFYAIVQKETNEIIGSINLLIGEASNFSIEKNEGELGFWIGEPFWGRGLAKEAIEIMLAYSFMELGLSKIWCGYFSDNRRSMHLQESCGFVYSYTIEQVHTLLGEDKKEIVMCMTREQYEENYE